MRKCRIIEQKTREIVDQFDPAAFRAQMREKHQARRMESDLYKAQKSCRNLDEKKEFPEPMEKFFWPPVEKKRSLEDDDEEEEEEVEEEEVFTVAEKLELLITYLRLTHLYILRMMAIQNIDEASSCDTITTDSGIGSKTEVDTLEN